MIYIRCSFYGHLIFLSKKLFKLGRTRVYSKNEELANTLSHAMGIVLGLVASYILLSKACNTSNIWGVGSTCAYLFGMISCYIISTCYHASTNEQKKRQLQKLDHASIYTHIAGTYTPFTLVTLREVGGWGWTLFAFVWLSAIVGIIISFKKSSKHSHLETICYITMGASILVAFKPLTDVLNANNQIYALYWLIGGGISYVIGAAFYSLAKVKYMHTVFHIFVLGGSICHILAIYIIL